MERSLQDAGNSKQRSYLAKTQIQTKWLCMFTKNAIVYNNSNAATDCFGTDKTHCRVASTGDIPEVSVLSGDDHVYDEDHG